MVPHGTVGFLGPSSSGVGEASLRTKVGATLEGEECENPVIDSGSSDLEAGRRGPDFVFENLSTLLQKQFSLEG